MSETVKVKPWGKDQGDYVLIEKADYNPEVHKLYEATKQAKQDPKPGKQDE